MTTYSMEQAHQFKLLVVHQKLLKHSIVASCPNQMSSKESIVTIAEVHNQLAPVYNVTSESDSLPDLPSLKNFR